MLTEKQIERYADVLIWGMKTARSGRFRAKDIILIRYHRPAIRLAEILYRRLVETGMHPVHRMLGTPFMERSFFELADNRQLTFRPPGEEELYGSLNGNIMLYAPESITHLAGIDPKKIGRTAVSVKHLRDIQDKRDAAGEFGWTLCVWPTEELAKQAGLTEAEYARQVVKACFLNKKNPLTEWRSIFLNAREIKKWLNGLAIQTLRVESKTVDLEIRPGEDRQWIGISGHNIPSFEIFLSPDWRGTRGVYTADQPSFRSGNRVSGVRLEFRRGAVVSALAEEGEEFLRSQINMDAGAKRIGEFSLTDKRFSKIDRFMANTLFDENFGGKEGNCHVALGSSYADSYAHDPGTLTREMKKKLGFNDSALHWDLVNTEKKRVTAKLAGGKTVAIYENGRFTL